MSTIVDVSDSQSGDGIGEEGPATVLGDDDEGLQIVEACANSDAFTEEQDPLLLASSTLLGEMGLTGATRDRHSEDLMAMVADLSAFMESSPDESIICDYDEPEQALHVPILMPSCRIVPPPIPSTLAPLTHARNNHEEAEWAVAMSSRLVVPEPPAWPVVSQTDFDAALAHANEGTRLIAARLNGADLPQTFHGDALKVFLPAGQCAHILKNLHNPNTKSLRFVLECYQGQAGVIIDATTNTVMEHRDWPTNRRSARWTSGDQGAPAHRCTIICDLGNNGLWRSLLITVKNDADDAVPMLATLRCSTLSANLKDVHKLMTGSIRERLHRRIVDIKNDTRLWHSFLARLEAVRRNRLNRNLFLAKGPSREEIVKRYHSWRAIIAAVRVLRVLSDALPLGDSRLHRPNNSIDTVAPADTNKHVTNQFVELDNLAELQLGAVHNARSALSFFNRISIHTRVMGTINTIKAVVKKTVQPATGQLCSSSRIPGTDKKQIGHCAAELEMNGTVQTERSTHLLKPIGEGRTATAGVAREPRRARFSNDRTELAPPVALPLTSNQETHRLRLARCRRLCAKTDHAREQALAHADIMHQARIRRYHKRDTLMSVIWSLNHPLYSF